MNRYSQYRTSYLQIAKTSPKENYQMSKSPQPVQTPNLKNPKVQILALVAHQVVRVVSICSRLRKNLIIPRGLIHLLGLLANVNFLIQSKNLKIAR